MNKKANNRGSLYIYLKWPLIVLLYMFFVTAIIYAINMKAGIILLAFSIMASVFLIYIHFYRFNSLLSAIQGAVENEAKVHGVYFSKIDVPHAVLSSDGRIIWANDNFLHLTEHVQVGQNISDTIVELNKTLFNNLQEEKVNLLTICGEKKYKVDMWKVDLSKFEDGDKLKIYNDDDKIILIYLYDQTELYDLKQLYDNNKQVTGYIYR